jgi:hypothetical protein
MKPNDEALPNTAIDAAIFPEADDAVGRWEDDGGAVDPCSPPECSV